MVALQGIERVYRVSSPIAQKTYPVASSMVRVLHALAYSRALAIQYALEADPSKLSFLKRQFESEFDNTQTLLEKVQKLELVSAKMKQDLQTVAASQKEFKKTSDILMEAHGSQLLLAQSRQDQIQEANRSLERVMNELTELADTYRTRMDFQFWVIAIQVILLEQRYLYQSSLSTPFSLTPERSREEEKKLLEHKEKFKNYSAEFFEAYQRLQKFVPPKHQKKWQLAKTHYEHFLERVHGENGVFLISEDEIIQLGTVGFYLETLEKAYREGAKASLEIQEALQQSMQAANLSITALKTKTYRRIFMFTVIFAFLGILLGLSVSREVLKPLEKFALVAKHIADGHLDAKIELNHQDEIGALAATFNHMTERLQQDRQKEKELLASLEQKVLERTHELAQKNLELIHANEKQEEFLSNITHDLKTPLNGILGYVQVILSDTKGALTEQQKKNLERVMKNGRELLQMINTVLDFTKAHAGLLEIAVEEFSFEGLLDECLEGIEILIKDKNIKVLKEIETKFPKLKTDRPKVKRILLNLLSNAVRYTEQGKIEVSVKRFDNMVEFSVVDTGVGMPRTEVLGLFDHSKPLRENKGGTGLGLMVTKQLVNVLRGTIEVHSEPKQGSTFQVRIPLVHEETSVFRKAA